MKCVTCVMAQLMATKENINFQTERFENNSSAVVTKYMKCEMVKHSLLLVFKIIY